MGGHGHELPESTKVQKPEFYKMENSPDLAQIHDELAKKGLKDPWARNNIWRYNPKYGTRTQRWLAVIFRGWKVGLGAFLITIGVEKALGIDYTHGHHEEHEEGGDH